MRDSKRAMRFTNQHFVRREAGVVWWVFLIIAVALAYAAASTGSLASSNASGTDVPGEPSRTCYTKCGFFMEFRCEDGKLIGACFPFWPCNAGRGPHQCLTSSRGDSGSGDVQVASNCSGRVAAREAQPLAQAEFQR